jgi:hypothetical protein
MGEAERGDSAPRIGPLAAVSVSTFSLVVEGREKARVWA